MSLDNLAGFWRGFLVKLQQNSLICTQKKHQPILAYIVPGSTKTEKESKSERERTREQFKQKRQEMGERKQCWFHLAGTEHGQRVLGLNGGLWLVYMKKNLYLFCCCEFKREWNLGALTSFEHFLSQFHSLCLATVSQKHWIGHFTSMGNQFQYKNTTSKTQRNQKLKVIYLRFFLLCFLGQRRSLKKYNLLCR